MSKARMAKAQKRAEGPDVAGERKNPGGRKALWDTLDMENRLDSVEGWARQGATEKEISGVLGVSERTFYAWKGRYPQFARALRAGARVSNGEILCSAFRQARGYFQEVTEPIKVRRDRIDPQTKKILVCEELETVTYTKYFPADSRMTRFMLMNRLAEEYREKEGRLDRDINIQVEGLCPEAQEKLMG